MNGLRLTAVLAFVVAGGPPACSKARDPPRQEARDTAVPGVASAAPLESLLAAGQRLYSRGEYDSARAVWRDILPRARAERDRDAEARLLTGLGLAAWRLGEPSEARGLGESALAVELQHGLTQLLPRSYNALALLAWDQGRLREAIDLAERSLAAARAVGDAEYLYKAANTLGNAYTQFGEFRTARESFLAALAGARRQGDKLAEGRVLSNLAMLDTEVGDPRAALARLAEARELARAAGDRPGEEHILGQVASAYTALGEIGPALAAVDSALREARRQGLRQAEAADLDLLAQLYHHAGDLRRALETYEQARVVNEQLGLAEEHGRDLANAAEILQELGNLELARRNALQALQIHQTIGARFAEFRDRLFLAQVEDILGRRTVADRQLDAARLLARGLGVRRARVEMAVAEARILDRRGSDRQLLAVVGSAAEDVPLTEYAAEWELHALQARAYARRGDLERLTAAARQAVAAIERVRGTLRSGILRTTFGSEKNAVYADLVAALIALGRVEEAFEVADAARGHWLGEVSVGADRPEARAASGSAVRPSEELLQRIDVLGRKITEALESDDATLARELEERVRRARREFEALAIAQAERRETRVSLAADQPPASAVIRSALLPGEVLIEYLVTPSRLFVFVVTRDGVRTVDTALAASDLERRVRLARELVADRTTTPEQTHSVLEALHGLLLAPLQQVLASQRVDRAIVVPHGVLSYVPFGALRDALDGRYLAQRYSLVLLPAAAALPVLRNGGLERRTQPERRSWSGAVFVPLPAELPASVAEARAVRRAIGRARVHVRAAASEGALRRALSEGRLVHVASHGVLNAYSPLFSRIELAGGASRGSADDGRLEVHEVLGLTIRSPLVFLSGCETGRGSAWATTFDRGEDYVTLARAFLQAGAGNVIATLWPVEDAGAAEFAERFYRHLGGSAPVEALAQAQRELLTDPRHRHPYYWAGYQLAGEGGRVEGGQTVGGLSVRH